MGSRQHVWLGERRRCAAQAAAASGGDSVQAAAAAWRKLARPPHPSCASRARSELMSAPLTLPNAGVFFFILLPLLLACCGLSPHTQRDGSAARCSEYAGDAACVEPLLPAWRRLRGQSQKGRSDRQAPATSNAVLAARGSVHVMNELAGERTGAFQPPQNSASLALQIESLLLAVRMDVPFCTIGNAQMHCTVNYTRQLGVTARLHHAATIGAASQPASALCLKTQTLLWKPGVLRRHT